MNKTLRIGITDCGKFENYRRWITDTVGMEVIKLSRHLQNASEVSACDGVLFSGGEDVDPKLYGKPQYAAEFALTDVIPARDRFEYEVIRLALAGKKPILGICRGLQLLNVFLGGTLVPDIPSRLHSVAHSKIGGVDQLHPIQVLNGSQLYQITETPGGTVNSAHHQSADQIAPALQITAYSDSDIVESLEWKEPANKNWLQLVQWHPERMPDLQSPFSARLKTAFLKVSGG